MMDAALLKAMAKAGVTADQIAQIAAEYEKLRGPDKTARRAERMDVVASEWYILRAEIFARDGYICAYCGDREGPHQVDHIVPLSRGGTSVPDNLCVACGPCNASKCDKLLSEWRGFR